MPSAPRMSSPNHSRRFSAGLVAARCVAAVPFAPPFAEWAEAITHPAIMDASKARQELGWRPRYSSLEALRDTLHSR
jgi:nucleoside-diphosphate-sugar epimerase